MDLLNEQEIEHLITLLYEYPDIDQEEVRDQLLTYLPKPVRMKITRGAAPETDIRAIIIFTNSNQLMDNSWPLTTVLRAAINRVRGLEIEARLQAWLSDIEQRIQRLARAPSTASLTNPQIAQLRDALVALGEQELNTLLDRFPIPANATAGANAEQRLLTIIQTANEQGWIVNLMQAAYDEHTIAAIQQLIDAAQNGQNHAAVLDPLQTWKLPGGKWMVDRLSLREMMFHEFHQEMGKRILLVEGPRYSGKTHCRFFGNYLRHYRYCRPILIDLQEYVDDGNDMVESVCKAIARTVGFELPPRTEQTSTWTRQVVELLADQLNQQREMTLIIFDHLDRPPLSDREVKRLILRLKTASLDSTSYLCLVLLGRHDELFEEIEVDARREVLAPIQHKDLDEFFGRLYREQQQLYNVPYGPEQIAESVQRVLDAGQGLASPEDVFKQQWRVLAAEANTVEVWARQARQGGAG